MTKKIEQNVQELWGNFRRHFNMVPGVWKERHNRQEKHLKERQPITSQTHNRHQTTDPGSSEDTK